MTPVSGEIFAGIKGEGVTIEVDGNVSPVHSSKDLFDKNNLIRFVASRSHLDEDTQNLVNKFEKTEFLSAGSSLKFLFIAKNEADVYPRFAPTMEWDTAAAHLIVNEAGGQVLRRDDLTPLQYNKENLLNPHFIVLCNESYKSVLS
jgi:3'(2'), 5'-bisphosphate nucleotidase